MTPPIYRAKKIDSEEWVEGYYTNNTDSTSHAIGMDDVEYFEIDPNTLAIHFPNMIEKNGKRIFASLSEDGVGGDCCENTIVKSIIKDQKVLKSVSMKHPFVFTTNGIYSGGIHHLNKITNFLEYEVIGIHKG